MILIITIEMAKGLLYCGGQWGTTYCVTKLLEAIISGTLIIAILIQVILDTRMRGGVQLGFTQIIQLLMLLTLICNLMFCITHNFTWCYYLESFFYDCYFCTLVFYVTYRIVQKSTTATLLKLRTLKILYVVVILGFFAIFLYSGLADIIDCKQIWFLVIDITGLLICSVMVQFGYRHHQVQTQKFLDFRNEEQINNPLSRMWTLILINLFCQIVQLTETLIFLIQASELRCHFSKQPTVDIIIKFIFSLFSLHLSFICTIVIFNMRRQSEENYSKTTSNSVTVTFENNGVEMAMMPRLSESYSHTGSI